MLIKTLGAAQLQASFETYSISTLRYHLASKVCLTIHLSSDGEACVLESRKPLNYIMFRQADALIRASVLIETETNKAFEEKKKIDDRIELLQSVILLRALSIELYFKTLLIIKRDDVLTIDDIKKYGIRFAAGRDGHDFIALLQLLDNETQKLLVREFSHLDSKIQTLENLTTLINGIGNTPFVDWRYIYEKSIDTRISLVDLTNLANALNHTVVSIKSPRPSSENCG